ncbi:MAG: hypothetical protein N2Z23_06215 [Pyrinomonadaceae bacterium]|nr:hypothetical protein [Pyrinomonadaceae bacterium]MCX7640017.1 hypothetical protein [Pyrinomonadaceae bacterium]MDW8304189.1 hypothetical protein [Acidobacteriota bacterium]
MKAIIKSKLLVLLFFTTLCLTFGQNLESSPGDRSRQREDLPKGIQETIERRRVEEEKKKFDELLQKAEEAVSLSQEVLSSYEQKESLTEEDQKKLERVEKAAKKIRDYLGGEDDEEKITENVSIKEKLEFLKEGSKKLLSILKKTSRFAISVTAIEISNELINVIKSIQVLLKLRR